MKVSQIRHFWSEFASSLHRSCCKIK